MKAKRIIMSFLGVIITAISIGAFKYAAFGVDPFQSFMSGIDTLIPIDFGTLYVLVNAALLLFALVIDRHYIGIATFLNLFLLGYVVDFSQNLLMYIFPAQTITVRIILFLAGFIFLCFGSSLYMTADMGVSTYDAIALICTHKWKMGKFRIVRIITDLLCILLGIGMFLLGGGTMYSIPTFVSIGTIITAFCMGPMIAFFNDKVSVPILNNATHTK